jgi:hypothetical protein
MCVYVYSCMCVAAIRRSIGQCMSYINYNCVGLLSVEGSDIMCCVREYVS